MRPIRSFSALVLGLLVSTSTGQDLVAHIPIQGGIIHKIDIDRSNPQRVVVGTEDHGVFYSDDGGDSWSFVHSFGNGRTYVTQFDPLDPNRIIFSTYGNGLVVRSTTGAIPGGYSVIQKLLRQSPITATTR